MLRELMRLRFTCPVCGRILYYHKGYWCPFCGTDLDNKEEVEVNLFADRLTLRNENGVPCYIGKHTFRNMALPQDMGISAIEEVLEKLCQYEEAESQEEVNNEPVNLEENN